jgi:hypothetical protein
VSARESVAAEKQQTLRATSKTARAASARLLQRLNANYATRDPCASAAERTRFVCIIIAPGVHDHQPADHVGHLQSRCEHRHRRVAIRVDQQHRQIAKMPLAHRPFMTPDAAPGVRASATEFAPGFVSTGWEAFDFALKRGVYFRTLFQSLLDALRGPETLEYAARLGGYDLEPAGELIWGME